MSKLWAKQLIKLNDNYAQPIYALVLKVHQILDMRLKNKIRRQDYLQILLDAYSDENEYKDQGDISEVASLRIEKKMTAAVII